MASFWAGSIARSIGGTKHAYGGIFVTALAAAAPLSDRSSTVCENNEEFRRRHEQLKASRKEVKLKTRMTSVGHFSLASQTPNNPSVASFFMTMVGEKPGFTSRDFQELWEERGIPERHPRFHYKISETNQGYFEPEATNDHVKNTFFPFLYRKEIQNRVKALQTEPLNVHDKTWEVQIASTGPVGTSGGSPANIAASNSHGDPKDLVESVLFFRGHHALGDGVSLFTAIMDLCDEAEEFRDLIKLELKKRFGRKRGVSILGKFVGQLKKFVQFCIGCLQAVYYQGKLYLGAMLESNALKQIHKWSLEDEVLEDETTTPKRSISYGMAAPVDEVKWVAQTLIGKKATVNDVFVSCVSAAVARQIAAHRRRLEVLSDVAAEAKDEKVKKRHAARRQLALMRNMNIVMPVHLYGGVMLPGQSLGNRIGAMVARVPGEDQECTERLEKVHKTLYSLKQTPTPLLSYMLVRLTSAVSGTFLPDSWTQYLFSKANANAVAVVSNVRGPPKPLHIKGRLISSVHGFVPLPPGIPIGIVVSSYAGNVKLSLSAEPWAVPDGDQFLVYVLEEYQSLLRRAKLKAISETKGGE